MPSSPAAGSGPRRDPQTTALESVLRLHLTKRGRANPRALPSDSSHIGPALTVLGLCGTRADVLDQRTSNVETAVLGLTLPLKYSAVAVIASSVVSTPRHRRYRDGTIALGVSRGGQAVSLLSTQGEILDTSNPHGWLHDACQRAVGMPTEPPALPSVNYSLALWLDRLMVLILHDNDDGVLDWEHAASLCPVPDPWRSADPGELGRILSSTSRPWPALRRSAAAGRLFLAGVSPAVAQWMDDGMFARWCMGSFPDLDSLRADVEFLAPERVASNVAHVITVATRPEDHDL